MECKYRCFCNDGVADRTQKPRRYPAASVGPKWPSSRTIEVALDNDPFAYMIDEHQTWGQRGQDFVFIETLSAASQAVSSDPGISNVPQRTAFSLEADNEIICSGALPNFPLPSPYTLDDFGNNQELCAVSLSGGNP